MQVSQVAYDRFVLELPAADSEWKPLADPEAVAGTAARRWGFGPTPLLAVGRSDGRAPLRARALARRGRTARAHDVALAERPRSEDVRGPRGRRRAMASLGGCPR